MVNKVTFRFLSHVYSRIETEEAIIREIYDDFSFMVPGYSYHPKFKLKQWDGQIHLLKWKSKTIYTGLRKKIEEFCQEQGYEIILEGFPKKEVHPDQVYKRDIVDIPNNYQLRDYQLNTIIHCIKNERSLLVSPTASGKSLIIYCILRYLNKKTLIIVPATNLIHQMTSDFQEYGYNQSIHKIYFGQEKETDSLITIATWQSVYKMPEKFFDKFDIIIGDECHHCKAKSLVTMLEKTPNIQYRFGFTGSLDGSHTNQMVLEGLFGPLQQFVSSKDLMDEGYISNLQIKSIILKYPEEICKAFKKTKAKYQQELDWLVSNKKRNRFIKDLALSLEGNTLILYRYVEKHGKPIFNLLENSKIPVYLVHGLVSSKEREEIRRIVNTHKNSITVASTGCYSEGINIPNVNNIILASPSKSRILVMQCIGRGLRKSESKDFCHVYDIADDLCHKQYSNHTFKHYQKRLEYYMSEKFSFKQFSTRL